MAANHTTATPSSKKSTQYILLSVFAILVILMYCLIFCTGGGKGAPKLGIDLQGGTRVTPVSYTHLTLPTILRV